MAHQYPSQPSQQRAAKFNDTKSNGHPISSHKLDDSHVVSNILDQWAGEGMDIPKNHTDQPDPRSSTSSAGTLTVEQRLTRIEKILAKMIIRHTDEQERQQREERSKRLKEQLVRDREMEMHKARYGITEFSAW